MNDTQVLIVGAGPTGLVLALFLAKAGIKPRIVAKTSGPGLASRAMIVQARTLEFYRQVGFADEVVSQGIQVEAIYLRAHAHAVAEIKIGDFGKGISPYPFPLSYPQDDHEKLLVAHLKAAGVEVEWDTELTEFQDSGADGGGGAVRATLRKADGSEEVCSAAYLCGCDGARSTVRQGLNLEFAGGTYDKSFYVADVAATGEAAAHQRLSFCLDAHDFLLVIPVRSSGMSRLIGVIPEELKAKEDVTFEDIRPFAEKAAGVHVENVNWFSTYHVHHRVAEHFRVGCAFVLGDAGHIHSPVGGQGMNTGIGDAVNLAWKLAAVLQARADASILDTYETERIAFARSLVATTDKAFQLMSGSGTVNQLFRETIFPHLMPFIMGFSAGRTAAFRLVSQTRISYHHSALSESTPGELHGGDRLPYVALANGTDNFAPLTSLDWQVHIYGEAKPALRKAAEEAGLPLHQFAWTDGAAKAEMVRNTLYLIRPDGYIGLIDDEQDVEALRGYLSRFGIVVG